LHEVVARGGGREFSRRSLLSLGVGQGASWRNALVEWWFTGKGGFWEKWNEYGGARPRVWGAGYSRNNVGGKKTVETSEKRKDC